MAMEHKAYAFDWESFTNELYSTLLNSLETDATEGLAAFIDANIASLTSPYDGEPLNSNWRSQLEEGDAQELADYALTRYYSPKDDYGVIDWISICDALPPPLQDALLGFPLGSPTRCFDPGKMGAYFQTPQLVGDSLAVLRKADNPSLLRFQQLLELSKAGGLGLYVTF